MDGENNTMNSNTKNCMYCGHETQRGNFCDDDCKRAHTRPLAARVFAPSPAITLDDYWMIPNTTTMDEILEDYDVGMAT